MPTICWYGSSPSAKTFYTGILRQQKCFTHAQHIARFTTMESSACGDKALEVAVINTYAGNRDGGDEGSEFFSYQVQRHLATANFVLKAAASRGTSPAPAHDARNLGEVPKWVVLVRSASRHSAPRSGCPGLPS